MDVHAAPTARKIRLLKHKKKKKKAVIELTENLREFCKEDPVKYDFALFGIGIQNQTADRH
jgi:iron only hydrogenase large subunit-like protein